VCCQHWGEDVIVDVICYRRHGHNELDQPAFTQPLLYAKIAKHPSTLDLFEQRLLKVNGLNKKRGILLYPWILVHVCRSFTPRSPSTPPPSTSSSRSYSRY
jgi:hypothetical protein